MAGYSLDEIYPYTIKILTGSNSTIFVTWPQSHSPQRKIILLLTCLCLLCNVGKFTVQLNPHIFDVQIIQLSTKEELNHRLTAFAFDSDGLTKFVFKVIWTDDTAGLNFIPKSDCL